MAFEGEEKSRPSLCRPTALSPNIGEHFQFLTFPTWPFWNQSADLQFRSYGKSEQKRRAVIPEPSFGFFLRAMGVMLLLVVVMTAYFSLRT
jgi:hypothetical protein